MAHNHKTLNNQIKQNNVSVAQMRSGDEGHAAAVQLADFHVANVSCSCVLDSTVQRLPSSPRCCDNIKNTATGNSNVASGPTGRLPESGNARHHNLRQLVGLTSP